MTTIKLPDEQAAALKAKAESLGMTLEVWLATLSGVQDGSVRRPKYKLEELLAQCDITAPMTEEDRAWLDDPAIGREAL